MDVYVVARYAYEDEHAAHFWNHIPHVGVDDDFQHANESANALIEHEHVHAHDAQLNANIFQNLSKHSQLKIVS